MNVDSLIRASARLAIHLLFAVVWGFSGLSKLRQGQPEWFEGKFGPTLLGKVPGVAATFWILTVEEVLLFGLCLVALVRLEFLDRRPTHALQLMLAGSLFVFAQLCFGQWLTSDFASAAQLFMYFSGTLLALHYIQRMNTEGLSRKSPEQS